VIIIATIESQVKEIDMDLAADFIFARDSGEFDGPRVSGKLVRYVAAINPDATRVEFIAAAVAAGFNANTAACRFLESRKFDMKSDPSLQMLADGRLVDKSVN
jgi:hypothetical protein